VDELEMLTNLEFTFLTCRGEIIETVSPHYLKLVIMTDEDKLKILDLIKQAREGKQTAFTKLYNKYRDTIYKTIYYIVKNKDVADDVLSTTFVKAFSKLDSYVNNISFEMWLKTIAINNSIDYIRRTKKEKYDHELDSEENIIQLSSTADYSPEENYLFKETNERLEKALSNLRWKYRNILELRTVQNMSYKQMSEQLGLTESQVKSLLNKAREKLKQLLN
jgi:RNA polymerase sigma-70 factor (ECF subfamily)